MLLAALALECAVFNMPFWSTVGASTDTASASNQLGPGLNRTDAGLLEVVDSTGAWLAVEADGTSGYARVDAVDRTAMERERKALASEQSEDDADDVAHLHLTSMMTLRLDAPGHAGRAQSVSIDAPRSLYVRAEGSGTLRVWFQEPAGTLLPVQAVRANVRVPFEFSFARVAVMLAVALAVALLRPGSRLWRIRLDPASRAQRLAFAACMAGCAALTAVAVGRAIVFASPLVFHKPGDYTYDFDQYGHVADALLAGHAWLDLPVPDALAAAGAPHDVGVRDQLLAQGATPLYWDYAFHDGHWYSYFGVLPAVLLFVPYRALTSLFVDGGLMLPSGAAVPLLMFGFLLFGSLLTLRLASRIAPSTPLAAAILALAVFLFGANAPYLWFRTNFYSVPMAASLMFTTLGLWLWLGADTSRPPLTPSDRWSVSGARPLSLPRLALGALCIAANIGCRPTFALSALLGFVIFRTQIAGLIRDIRSHTAHLGQALRAPAAVLLPALAVAIPVLAYNVARFGSSLDFGERYQMTVTDMTRFTQPLADVPVTIGYYLFLPLRLTDAFPWVALSPTPMPQWAYAEPMVGGLFVLCPFVALAFAAPFLRRRMQASGQWPFAVSCLTLGLALVVIDTLKGGLGWRYIADFGWLFALASLPALLALVDGRRDWTDTPASAAADVTDAIHMPPLRTRLWRWTALALLLAVAIFTALSCFTPGRSDELLNGAPALYHEVTAWFRLL